MKTNTNSNVALKLLTYRSNIAKKDYQLCYCFPLFSIAKTFIEFNRMVYEAVLHNINCKNQLCCDFTLAWWSRSQFVLYG